MVATKTETATKPATTKPAKVVKPVAPVAPDFAAVNEAYGSVIDGLLANIQAIDEEAANYYLLHNRTNRPLKAKRVTRYCGQMLAGEWAWHLPFTIVLDNEENPGNHNSQHTLTAFLDAIKIVKAARGKAFDPKAPTLDDGSPTTGPDAYPSFAEAMAACVITGINEDDADFLDIGDARVAGDVLFRKHLFEGGYKGPAGEPMLWKDGPKRILAKWLGTALKIVYNRLYLGVKVRNAKKFEQGSMLATLAKHERIIESCVEVWCANQLSASKGKVKDGISSKISVPYAIAAHYLAWHSEQDEDGVGTRREAADRFIRNLATGEATGKGNPLFELREFLVAYKDDKAKGNVGLDMTYDSCVVAWNAYIAGKKLDSKKGAAYLLAVDQNRDAETGEWLHYPRMGGLDTRQIVSQSGEEESEE